MRWFRGRNKMFLFVNGKTSVMLLRFRMHTHHNLLPLLIALEKKNKSPTLWETATIQCLELIAVTRCCPPLRVKKNIEVLQKSRDTHPWNLYYQCILPLPKFSSHSDHLVKFRENIRKKLMADRKKANQWHQWPTYSTHKPFLTVKRRSNQRDVAGNAGRKK